MIDLVNVNKEYFFGTEKISVLQNITLSIKERELVGIIGMSGSGKSTLMHIIGLLDPPTSGRMTLNDIDILKLDDEKLSSLRNEYIGFVFQQFNLVNNLTVLENILLPVVYRKKKLDFDPKQKALDLLKRFNMLERKDFYPNKISGGQQQRVAILRALIMDPKVILADEPTGNLDTQTGGEILSLLEELNKELKVTIVIVSHEKDIVKKTRRQIVLKDGRIVN